MRRGSVADSSLSIHMHKELQEVYRKQADNILIMQSKMVLIGFEWPEPIHRHKFNCRLSPLSIIMVGTRAQKWKEPEGFWGIPSPPIGRCELEGDWRMKLEGA